MAESVRFELTVRCRITSFQDWLLKPLGQLSVCLKLYHSKHEKSSRKAGVLPQNVVCDPLIHFRGKMDKIRLEQALARNARHIIRRLPHVKNADVVIFFRQRIEYLIDKMQIAQPLLRHGFAVPPPFAQERLWCGA